MVTASVQGPGDVGGTRPEAAATFMCPSVWPSKCIIRCLASVHLSCRIEVVLSFIFLSSFLSSSSTCESSYARVLKRFALSPSLFSKGPVKDSNILKGVFMVLVKAWQYFLFIIR